MGVGEGDDMDGREGWKERQEREKKREKERQGWERERLRERSGRERDR